MLRSAHLRGRAFLLSSLLALASLASAGPPPLPAPDLEAHTFDGAFYVVGIAANGNIYVAGTFSTVDGKPRDGIARFKVDGTLDAWAPSLPSTSSSTTIQLAVEDMGGNVALSKYADFDASALIYVPATTQAGVLVASEAPGTRRAFRAIAFDSSGTLFAALSGRCAFQISNAEVRKYTGGTAVDASFSLSFPTYLLRYWENGGLTSTTNPSCVSSIEVDGDQLYVGGRFDPGIVRVSTSTGAVDSGWKPLAYAQIDRIIVTANAIYTAGAHVPSHGVQVPSRLSKAAGGTMEKWWPEVSVSGGTIDLEPSGAFLYASGSAGLKWGVVALDLQSNQVSSWDPGARQIDDIVPVPIGHIRALADRLVFAGEFTFVSDQRRYALAAVPLASAPVAWPMLSVSPEHLDFGGTFHEGTQRSRTFTITNSGVGSLDIQGFTVPQLTPAVQQNNCDTPLGPGASCTVTVTATLTVNSPLLGTLGYYAGLTIQSNGGGSQRQVRLHYNEGDRGFAMESPPGSPTVAVAFPATIVGTSRTREIVFRNKQPLPIEFEDARTIPYDGSVGEVVPTHDCPAVVPVGGTCHIKLVYTPKTVGPGGTVLRVTAGGSGPQAFYVIARGIALEGDFDNDGLSNGEEAALGRDPAIKDNDVFTDPRLFAMQQYRDFLGRTGDDGGVAFWAGRIASGSISRADAIASFMASGEFEGIAAPVTRLYLAYFLRIPDYQGLDYWIGSARGGNPLASISTFFAGSGEFQSRYGVLDNAQFVDRVYRNVLGRAPDAGGQAFWLGQLNGGSTRGEVMLGFSESAEYRTLTSSQAFVTMVYAGMLRRAPDAASYANWVSWLDAGNPRSLMIETVLASPEYRARFMQ